MSLWLPNNIAESIRNEAEVRREGTAVSRVERELKTIDSRLDIILIAEDMPEHDLQGGFYYIRRRNDDGTMAFWEIRNPDGSYREPDSAIVEAMRRIDSTHENVLMRGRREKAKRKREAERRQEEKRRQFREGLAERLKFQLDTPSRPRKGWGLRKGAGA